MSSLYKKKYYYFSAAGNTFLIFDNRNNNSTSSKKLIDSIDFIDLDTNSKTRSKIFEYVNRYNIDGVISLESSKLLNHNFKMRYFNCDGSEVEMCGNGIRALSWFAYNILKIKIINFNHNSPLSTIEMRGSNNLPQFFQAMYLIQTMCASYNIFINTSKHTNIKICVEMNYLKDIALISSNNLLNGMINSLYLNTGVPHIVFLLKDNFRFHIRDKIYKNIFDISSYYLEKISLKIMKDKRFPNGVNINFLTFLNSDQDIKQKNKTSSIFVRTVERGVERETLSCGTGVCASSYLAFQHSACQNFSIKTSGGIFNLNIKKINNQNSQKDKKIIFYLTGDVELIKEIEL